MNRLNNTANLNQAMADENCQIMGWLSPLDPQRKHQDVRTDRFDSVGSGYLESSKFREWTSGEGAAGKAVFCYGNPEGKEISIVSDRPLERNRSYH